MLYEVIRWDANRLASRLLLESWNNYFHFHWLICSRNCFPDELQPICRYMKSKTHFKNTLFILLWKGKCPHSTMSWTVSELSWCQTDRKDTRFSVLEFLGHGSAWFPSERHWILNDYSRSASLHQNIFA